jgi:hypothetical protein
MLPLFQEFGKRGDNEFELEIRPLAEKPVSKMTGTGQQL